MQKPAHVEANAKADVLLVVPLQEEFHIIKKMLEMDRLPIQETPRTLQVVYEAHTTGGLHIVAIVLDEMANEHSAMMTERCIVHFRPRFVVGIGIGGSLDEDILLGDVVVSENVTNFLFESKAVPDPRKGYALRPSAGGFFDAADRFPRYFHNFKSTHAALWATWQEQGAEQREHLNLPTEIVRRRGILKCANEAPDLHIGPVASGPSVAAAKAYGAELKDIAHDFLVLEMEGAGIALSCTQRGREPSIDFLLLRGISDFSDERKKKLERQFQGKWRRLAISNAAKLLTLFLDDPEFVELLRPRETEVRVLPEGKTRFVRIALMLNDTLHYVDEIDYGFTDELRGSLPEELELRTIRAVGSPETREAQANEFAVEELVNGFVTEVPDYVVTIGTAVSQAAVQVLPNSFKIVFIGVTDPSGAGLLDRPIGAGSAFVAGVRYGLPIDQTVGVLRSAFPGLVPVYVYSGERFAQDSHLLAGIRHQFKGGEVEVLNMEEAGPIPEDTNGRVYFGRFFLCKYIGEFAAANPRRPFVGVSRENVGMGAVMAVGHIPEQIGRTAAREIVLQDVIEPKSVAHGTVLEPQDRLVTVSQRRLRECRVSISDTFSEEITWYNE